MLPLFQVGKAYTPDSIASAMQLLAYGEAVWFAPLLDMLNHALVNKAAKSAAFGHDAGMKKLADIAYARLDESPQALKALLALASDVDIKPKLASYLVQPMQTSKNPSLQAEAAR